MRSVVVIDWCSLLCLPNHYYGVDDINRKAATIIICSQKKLIAIINKSSVCIVYGEVRFVHTGPRYHTVSKKQSIQYKDTDTTD